MTALQKQEQRRYQSPAALAQDLQRFRQGRPILARPDSARYRLGKFVRRNRTAVASGGRDRRRARRRDRVLGRADAGGAGPAPGGRCGPRAARPPWPSCRAVFAGDSRDPDGKPAVAGRPDRDGRARRDAAIPGRSRGSSPASWPICRTRYYEAGDLQAQRAMLGRARTIALEAKRTSSWRWPNCLRAISYWVEDMLDSARADVREAKAALARAGAAGPDGRGDLPRGGGEAAAGDGQRGLWHRAPQTRGGDRRKQTPGDRSSSTSSTRSPKCSASAGALARRCPISAHPGRSRGDGLR